LFPRPSHGSHGTVFDAASYGSATRAIRGTGVGRDAASAGSRPTPMRSASVGVAAGWALPTDAARGEAWSAARHRSMRTVRGGVVIRPSLTELRNAPHQPATAAQVCDVFMIGVIKNWHTLSRLVQWADQHTNLTIWYCLPIQGAVLLLAGIERLPLPKKPSGNFDSVKSMYHPEITLAALCRHASRNSYIDLLSSISPLVDEGSDHPVEEPGRADQWKLAVLRRRRERTEARRGTGNASGRRRVRKRTWYCGSDRMRVLGRRFGEGRPCHGPCGSSRKEFRAQARSGNGGKMPIWSLFSQSPLSRTPMLE
jgi:hypothetical protein